MKKMFCLFVLIGVFVFQATAFAESKDDQKASAVKMDEVVVTATKTEEKRKDIPNSVVVIDQMDIQDSAAKSLGELLANELGIDWRTYGNYGGAAETINIRGFGSDGTQIYVNGVNVTSPSLGEADAGRIPLNNIERIEVVKGSGSLLYGTGAMGGTVHIITKRPERDQLDLKVSAGCGTEETYKISAEQGMFITDNLGYYLTANRRETDGFRDNSDLEHNDMSFKLVFDKGDILDVSLYADYIDREFGLPGVEPPPGTAAFSVNGQTLYNDETANLLSEGEDEDYHMVLQIKSKPVDLLDFNLKFDYTDMEGYNYNRYYSSLPAPGLPGSRTWVRNKVSGFEGNMNVEPLKDLSFLIGTEYRDYDWENESSDLDGNGSEVAGSRDKTKADIHTKAGFLEAQFRPCKYVKLLAGLRGEDHSKFGTENIPRYGMVINPNDTTVLKVSHGKHFKAPTPNDLFWPAEDWGFGMGTSGNINLEPETGWHTDATVEQSFVDNKIFMTLSYFKWDLEDKIRWAPDEFYFYMPENLDSYEADGVEAGIKIGPFYNMSTSLTYTYTDAEEKSGNGVKRQAQDTPDNQFKGSITYWADFGLIATATFRYVSERPGEYDDEMSSKPSLKFDSYWTTDIKLEQRLFDNWLLAVNGNNLFDEEYDTFASSFRNQSTGVTTLEGYPGSGRSVFFSVSYEM